MRAVSGSCQCKTLYHQELICMQTLSHFVVLSLGSNCGDRENNVAGAIDWLRLHVLSDCECSEIYETLPVGHSGSNYINAVVAGFYSGCLEDLERLCKEYERSNGRDEESRKLNMVPVDIDVVIADGDVLRERDFKCSFFQKGYHELAVPSRSHKLL